MVDRVVVFMHMLSWPITVVVLWPQMKDTPSIQVRHVLCMLSWQHCITHHVLLTCIQTFVMVIMEEYLCWANCGCFVCYYPVSCHPLCLTAFSTVFSWFTPLVTVCHHISLMLSLLFTVSHHKTPLLSLLVPICHHITALLFLLVVTITHLITPLIHNCLHPLTSELLTSFTTPGSLYSHLITLKTTCVCFSFISISFLLMHTLP